jgi:hypothetical protein
MYQIILEYSQLLAGVQYPILQHPKPKLPHIKDLLITTICQFLANSQLNNTKAALQKQPKHHG